MRTYLIITQELYSAHTVSFNCEAENFGAAYVYAKKQIFGDTRIIQIQELP